MIKKNKKTKLITHQRAEADCPEVFVPDFQNSIQSRDLEEELVAVNKDQNCVYICTSRKSLTGINMI